MEQFFVIGLFVVAVGVGWMYVMSQKSRYGVPVGRKENQCYACIEVHAGESACAAAQAHCHVRYLVAEAPGLPLHDCTAARCTCKQLQFEDRRRRETRATSLGQGQSGSLMVDAAYDARKQRLSHAIWEVSGRSAHWSRARAPYATVGERRLRAGRFRSSEFTV